MDSLQKKLQILEKVKSQRDEFRGVFDLFEKIFIERERIKEKLDCPENCFDDAGIALRVNEGFPLIIEEMFFPHLDILEEYFNVLTGLISLNNDSGVAFIKSTMQKNNTGFKTIVKALLGENAQERMAPFQQEKNLLIFIIRECLKPVLEVYKDQLKDKIDVLKMFQGTCPICGGFPFLAHLRGEEGKRYLFCSDCFMEWSFERIKCPFCENNEQGSMGYFSPENESQYNVTFCKKCKRYVKTIDSRNASGQMVPEIENLATLHLDVIAQKEGLKSEEVLIHLLI